MFWSCTPDGLEFPRGLRDLHGCSASNYGYGDRTRGRVLSHPPMSFETAGKCASFSKPWFLLPYKIRRPGPMLIFQF